MGYLKNNINNLTPLVGWNVNDGIYVKKIKNYCFIHSCNLNDTTVLMYLLKKIQLNFEKIFINNIGTRIEQTFGENIILNEFSDDISLFEIPTINCIRDFSIKNPNVNILYLHTKGITRWI